MRIAIISIILLLSKFSFANSATFKNYSDLDKCIKNYSSFVDYKSKLKKCFSDQGINIDDETCLLYTSPSPRDRTRSRMPSSA